ncbi:Ubiquitin C-terminal hydrolase 12 [Linum perenne]
MATRKNPAMKNDTKKFTWRIENFSKLKTLKLYSDTFLAGGYKWRVLVHPKGNKDKVDVNFLSVYLDFADPKIMPDGWNAAADFSITLVDQRSFQHSFNKHLDDWGFTSFVPISDLNRKGFLVNDAIVIETEIFTYGRASEAATSEPKVTRADQPRKVTRASFSGNLPPANQEAATEELKEIDADHPRKVTKASTEPLPTDQKQVDNPSKADSAVSPFSPSAVQFTSRNLIAELSAMNNSSHSDSSSSDEIEISSSIPDSGSSLVQQQREKLVEFFDMSLEALCQDKSFCEVENIANKIVEQVTDPLEKTIMEDLVSRLAEFKEVIPSSLSTIESSHATESSVIQTSKGLEARLAHKKGQLTTLEAEVSRLGKEGMKLENEIQQLTTCKDEILDHMNSAKAELKKVNQEASEELVELKKQHDERKEAGRKRMRAEEKLAQSNASWKLFKKNLGWQ